MRRFGHLRFASAICDLPFAICIAICKEPDSDSRNPGCRRSTGHAAQHPDGAGDVGLHGRGRRGWDRGAGRAQQRSPSTLILADVAMPRMNGYQLYEELRRDPRWVLIPLRLYLRRARWTATCATARRWGPTTTWSSPSSSKTCWRSWRAGCAERRSWRRRSQRRQAGRRRQSPPAEGEVIIAGYLRISPKQHRVWKDGEPVELSPKEFAFLEYLIRRPGQAVPLTELCRATHGLDSTAVEAGNLLYPLIRSLRRRLGCRPARWAASSRCAGWAIGWCRRGEAFHPE